MATKPTEEELKKKAEEKAKQDDIKYRAMVHEGAKAIYEAGLVEYGEGNVSVRVRKKDEMYITPSQNDYASMTENDVCHLKFSGEHLSQGRRASSEYLLHKAIYEARPHANVVIHNHSKYASMMAIAGKDLPLIIEEMAFFIGGDVRVSGFGESGSEEVGKRVLEVIGSANAAFIRNHGVVVCAKDVKLAVKTAMLVEKMSEIYWGASMMGPINKLSDAQTKKWIEMFDGLNSTK